MLIISSPTEATVPSKSWATSSLLLLSTIVLENYSVPGNKTPVYSTSSVISGTESLKWSLSPLSVISGSSDASILPTVNSLDYGSIWWIDEFLWLPPLCCRMPGCCTALDLLIVYSLSCLGARSGATSMWSSYFDIMIVSCKIAKIVVQLGQGIFPCIRFCSSILFCY